MKRKYGLTLFFGLLFGSIAVIAGENLITMYTDIFAPYPEDKALHEDVGRFELEVNESDVFRIDSKTGRVWRLGIDDNNYPTWFPVQEEYEYGTLERYKEITVYPGN